MNAIKIENVSKVFGDFRAVDRVNFAVKPGCIYGVLGPNGAGKTTTIRMINYITIPDEGVITINGQQAGRATQEMIGYLPEERGLYKKMKVGEQLIYLARLKGMKLNDARASLKFWLERFDAYGWIDKEVNELSKGMQQKIQFITTIVHDPEICIFDEPFSGLDPINSELLREVILELKEKGKTILFATHRMEQVEQMCDDICLFNRGKVILEGNLNQIKRSFGRNMVNLEFEGDGSFLQNIEGIRVNNKSVNFAEIRLLNGVSEQDILIAAMKHVRVTKYEFVQPSLHEIFISTVGTDNVPQS